MLVNTGLPRPVVLIAFLVSMLKILEVFLVQNVQVAPTHPILEPLVVALVPPVSTPVEREVTHAKTVKPVSMPMRALQYALVVHQAQRLAQLACQFVRSALQGSTPVMVPTRAPLAPQGLTLVSQAPILVISAKLVNMQVSLAAVSVPCVNVVRFKPEVVKVNVPGAILGPTQTTLVPPSALAAPLAPIKIPVGPPHATIVLLVSTLLEAVPFAQYAPLVRILLPFPTLATLVPLANTAGLLSHLNVIYVQWARYQTPKLQYVLIALLENISPQLGNLNAS